MTDYISVRISATPCTQDITDLLAAYLADIGYESFEPDGTGVTAYVAEQQFDKTKLDEVLAGFPIAGNFSYDCSKIEGRDWNSEWEKNFFNPIVIGGKCLIHSTFHKDLPEVEHDIIIDPKMAFGTGHHSTTSLMVSYLLDMQLTGKSVIDMGTGTGILAILCKRLGAANVTGIEIDPGAYDNAKENAALNGVSLNLVCGDASSLSDTGKCDVFIANINRNIILVDMGQYAKTLNSGANVLFSGFLQSDIEMVAANAAKYGMTLAETRTDNDWAALRFVV